MKTSWKIFSIALLVFGFMASPVQAQALQQNQDRPEVIAKTQTAEVNDALNLSGDQQRAVFRALVTRAAQTRKAGANNNADSKAQTETDFVATMKGILTETQFSKWQKIPK